MLAVFMPETGTAEVLTLAEVAEPAISDPHQIKVRLKAAGVNPIDTKLRKNGLFFENALPAILGCDGAGEVVGVGSAVTRWVIGRKVWFCNGGLGSSQGNYTQFAILDERWVSAMPATIDFESAAAGPLVLITAWGALYDKAQLQSGQTVLIHAGVGGVGHVAIQLAKIRGARVIVTVGSPENARLAKELGADEAINYREQDFVEAVNQMTNGKGADVVFEMLGPEVFERSVHCTAYCGMIVTILDFQGADLKEARLRNLRIAYELMLTPQLRPLAEARAHQIEILNQCGQWIDEGKLKLLVSQVLPLQEVVQAHRQIESGRTVGKLVLKID